MNQIKIIFTLFYIAISTSISAQPQGYYSQAIGLEGEALQQALHDIIDDHTTLSYSDLWQAFKTTDKKENGNVWDIYSFVEWQFSSDQCGNVGNSEGICYNREHSFPSSWFDKDYPMYSDLFHIYPSDGYVNGIRANYPLGETNNAVFNSSNGCKLGSNTIDGYSGTIFEPSDEYKGDFARTYFYMATRYYNEDSGWKGSPMVIGSQPRNWALQMLIKWHLNDPVSTKEINRNNAIFELQGNRNPYIDHPEYVLTVWESSTTEADEPTNNVSNFGTSFITLSWNDATGTLLPDGYLILFSDISFENIPTPEDGNNPTSYINAKTIDYGVEQTAVSGLNKNTKYYFKIYSYKIDNGEYDYKTDGDIPSVSKTTAQ